ncbi:MAG: SdrD B-like domain-containing protein, partial [Thiothrix litoralis]
NGFDPAGFHQNGLYWLDNNTGADAKRYSIYTTEPNTTFPTATMGKTAGLGDLELVVDAAPIEVGNRVWLDADGDGIQDAGEVGIDGVAVQLVCGSDEATTTTANGGQFLFSNAQGGHAPFMQAAKTCTIRVNSTQAPVKDDSLTLQNADGMTENNPQTDLRDSDAIDKAGVAEIQFTVGNAGDNNHTLDIGYKSQLVNPVTIIPPIDTCPALDYSYVVAKAAAGDPLIVGGTSSESKSLMVFPKSATGSLPLGTGTALEKYAENWQVGTVWGLAVQGSEKKVFSSAMLKRHAGLGPNGLGAIYVSDLNSGSGTAPMTTSKFVDLVADFGIDVGQAQVPDNAGRGLPAKTGSPSLDNAVFPLIGTVGLGDLDIDESGSHLFVVNLFDKKIYKINIAQGISDAPVAYSIPATNGAAGTTMRPWGLEIAGGKLYAGVVYTPSGAGVASDLSAAIYQMDLASGVWEATPVIPFALNYPRGLADDSTSGNWRPWEDDYSQWLNTSGEVSINPQPVLADMELDSEGAFHIAFIDRASHQVGNSNLKPDGSGDMTSGVSAGDLLRTWNDGGVIRLESKGIAGGYTSSGTGVDVKGAGGSNANQGPDGGEFYWADNFSEGHSETMFGGLALHLLDKRLAATVMNPLDGRTNAGGMRILDTDNGAPLQNYEVYAKDFGKAAGLGDLELVCEKLTPAVHSIGNRVWIDANNNGVADIGESAVSAGVKLDLKNASGGVLNTTTTDVNGRYLFSGLDAGSYQVCVSADNFAASAVLEHYTASTGKTPVPKADTDNT